MTHHWGYLGAVSAAVLFGVNAALSKMVLADVTPFVAAGFVYFFAGVVLVLVRLSPVQKRILSLLETPTRTETRVSKRDYGVLSAVILSGAVIAPLLYFYGLNQTTAMNTALLLNTEALFTASIAFALFRERGRRSEYASILVLILGAVILTTNGEFQKTTLAGEILGNVLVVGACFFWSIDNSLSSLLSKKRDLIFITALKCLVGGVITLSIAMLLRLDLNIPLSSIPYLASIGALSVGFSIVLFLFALREIGAMRTSVVFSTSALFGATFAFLTLRESFTLLQLAAGITMLVAIYVMYRK